MTGRLLALALAAAGAWAALRAWRAIPLGTLAEPGPGLFPFLLAVALALLGLAAALMPAAPAAPAARGRALAVAALLVAYPLALPRLGFALSTALGLLLLARAIEARSLGRLAAFALLVTVGAVLLFRQLLAVPLPRGPWGF